MQDFNFEDIFGQFKQPKPHFRSTGITGLDEAIEKVTGLNKRIQEIGK